MGCSVVLSVTCMVIHFGLHHVWPTMIISIQFLITLLLTCSRFCSHFMPLIDGNTKHTNDRDIYILTFFFKKSSIVHMFFSSSCVLLRGFLYDTRLVWIETTETWDRNMSNHLQGKCAVLWQIWIGDSFCIFRRLKEFDHVVISKNRRLPSNEHIY